MATLSVGGTTVFDGSALQSGVTGGTQFKSSTPVAGDIIQYRYKEVAGGSNTVSSSTTNTVAGCAISIISDVIDTGSTTSTIWKVHSEMCTNADVLNSCSSCRHWYSIDGGTSYTLFVTSGSHSSHGNYILYDQGDNGYLTVSRTDYMVMAANEGNVKFAAAFYSAEGDSQRWNHNTGVSPPYLECIQIKI